jgi:hypothetical protein
MQEWGIESGSQKIGSKIAYDVPVLHPLFVQKENKVHTRHFGWPGEV